VVVKLLRICLTNIVARVRRRDDRPPSGWILFFYPYEKYGETRYSCLVSVENLNGSRHLVFWSLGTLTGLRDRIRRLVA
jgi:hypothetical protein